MTFKGKYFDKNAENNIREVDLKFIDKFGLYVRPGHSDELTLKECLNDYPHINLKDKIVLDLGAHIGGFTKIALDQGAKGIVAFEPDLFNFEVLNVNIQNKRTKLLRAAVISGDDPSVILYCNGSKRSSASASLNKLRGAVSKQKVKAIKFDKIIKKLKPQIIKIDIEGGEYDLLLDYVLPEYVEEVVIEMHAFRKAQKPLMEKLRKQFNNGEWEIINEDEQKVFGGISLVCAHYKRVTSCDHIRINSTLRGQNNHKNDHINDIKHENLSESISPSINYKKSSLSGEINNLCKQHFDTQIAKDFEFFIETVNKRIEWQYGLRDSYEAPDGIPALGPDVEYFGFHLLMDDRMRYIAKYLVAIPDSKLSPANKICNTLISHFYGARGIHQTITKIEDPAEAHVDFEKMIVDNDYRLQMRQNLIDAQEKKIPIYGATELRTSLFGAANAHVTKKYNFSKKNSEPGNILEWVADFISDGTIDKILKVKSLKGMFKILTSKKGIGNYYGYHGSTSNSVNPSLPFDHDEKFVVPGPGSSKTARLMFPELSEKKVCLGDRVIWVRENQNWILPNLKIHPFFYNLKDYKDEPIFENDITELKCYTTEVGMCQYGIFRRLRENPHLCSRRKVSRADDNNLGDQQTKIKHKKVDKKQNKKMAIDLISGHLTNRIHSHKAAWAYLLANQLSHKFNTKVEVLHKGKSWDDYDTILLYHGMEFSGTLNLFGGANKKSAKMFERILNYDGRLISLDIPMPDYGELCKQRNKNADEYWKNVNWDALSEKCKKIPYLKHVHKTDKLVIGDSHAGSVYKPGMMVIRYDFKTLFGALKIGLKNIIIENKIDPDKLKHITFYFGNIDIRHHLARQKNIRSACKDLVRNYIKEIKKLKLESVEIVQLLPIENESRKIPKSGFYEGTPFYGSWKIRNKIRNYINNMLNAVCNQFGWKFYVWDDSIYNNKGELSFNAMEKPRSVHLSPEFYRWNLREDKPNY